MTGPALGETLKAARPEMPAALVVSETQSLAAQLSP
jgi:hypothetical protein